MSGLAVKPDWPDGGVLEASAICLGVDGGVGSGEGEGNFLFALVRFLGLPRARGFFGTGSYQNCQITALKQRISQDSRA